MAVVLLKREFSFNIGNKDVVLPDPDPNMNVEKVKSFYSLEYPEIINSILDEQKNENDKIMYIFKSKFGTKG